MTMSSKYYELSISSEICLHLFCLKNFDGQLLYKSVWYI